MASAQKPIITEQPIGKNGKHGKLPLLLGILGALLVGGGIYFFSTFSPESSAFGDFQDQKKKVQVKNTDWKSAVFEHPVFKSLGNPIEQPLEVGDTGGNPNPFIKALKKE